MMIRRALVCCVLAIGVAHADPVLVRRAHGGGVLEVDRVEDLVALLARQYQTLTPAETAAWKERQRQQDKVDASLQENAEHRGFVYVTGVLVALFVLGTFWLVYWVRNKSSLR